MFAKRSPQQVAPNPYTRVPETPPDLPLDCHTRAGFPVGNPIRFTRAAGGAINPPCLEDPPLRGRYFSGLIPPKREVNDETRSNRYRKRGLLGFNRLDGGGQCTSQYQPERLPR